MNTSKTLLSKLYEFFADNISFFKDFEHVYLFGSILKEDSYPHDIDLLLIYPEYNSNIIGDIKLLSFVLEREIALQLDLTVLSREELVDTQFLNRINHYIVLK